MSLPPNQTMLTENRVQNYTPEEHVASGHTGPYMVARHEMLTPLNGNSTVRDWIRDVRKLEARQGAQVGIPYMRFQFRTTSSRDIPVFEHLGYTFDQFIVTADPLDLANALSSITTQVPSATITENASYTETVGGVEDAVPWCDGRTSNVNYDSVLLEPSLLLADLAAAACITLCRVYGLHHVALSHKREQLSKHGGVIFGNTASVRENGSFSDGPLIIPPYEGTQYDAALSHFCDRLAVEHIFVLIPNKDRGGNPIWYDDTSEWIGYWEEP